jgi:hypothetical protein
VPWQVPIAAKLSALLRPPRGEIGTSSQREARSRQPRRSPAAGVPARKDVDLSADDVRPVVEVRCFLDLASRAMIDADGRPPAHCRRRRVRSSFSSMVSPASTEAMRAISSAEAVYEEHCPSRSRPTCPLPLLDPLPTRGQISLPQANVLADVQRGNEWS